MAQVPYEKVPDVSPVSQQIPAINVSTPGEAFGLNIAHAVGGLGNQIADSGDKLFSEAMKLKKDENDTWAKDQDVDAMIKIGEAKNDFIANNEGMNAAKALPDFNERIKKIREDALAGAPNADARRKLDAQLARRVGFAIVDAGAHAGQQAKAANDRAGAARQGAAQDHADPSNPASFDNDLDVVKREIIQRGQEKGDKPEAIRKAVEDGINKTILSGISKMAPNDPERARNFFEQNKDRITNEGDREKALTIVNRNMALHQSRDEAHDILKDFDPQKGPGQDQRFLDEAKKRAKDKGNLPDYEDYLVGRVRSGLNMGHAAYRDTQMANKQTVESFVLGKKEGEKIIDIDGITGPKAPKEIRDAYNSLNPDYQKSILSFVAKENKIATPYTQERQARFQSLMGMSVSDPAKFAQLSFLNEDLPRGKIDELYKKQLSVTGKTADDTNINRYVGWATPTLRAMGIVKGTPESDQAKQYDHFVGALQAATDEYGQLHGKPPGPKEVKALTQDLLKQYITHEGWIWNTKQRRFEVIPDEDRAQLTDAFKAEMGGRAPTESQLFNYYTKIKKIKPAL